MLLTDENAALAQLTATFGDGWVFTVDDAGRWRAEPPDGFGDWSPVVEDDPISLAKTCGQIGGCELLTAMLVEERAREAEQWEAGRERREQAGAALRTSPFLHSPGCGCAGCAEMLAFNRECARRNGGGQ